MNITERDKLQKLNIEGYTYKEMAHAMNVSTSTIFRNLKKDIEIEQVPSEERDIDEILEARKKEFTRREKANPSMIQVKVNIDGPIGIAHLGDPHLDDPGTNIARIEEDLNIIKKTHGMFGANVGDMQNNWVGRLAKLHEDQGTTKTEAWKLVEWFVNKIDFMYLVGGNHDAWSGSNDPLTWITRQSSTDLHYYGVRLKLKFPNKREVRINARHDFKGYSQWNPAHGPMKAIQMGWRDHILTCGHTHQAGLGVLAHPDKSQRIISWAIRVPSYKILDSYAHEIGAAGNFVSPCCTTIINPYATREEGLITVIWDLNEAADYLTYLRKKYQR
jgi:hypothetical protein